MARLAKHGAVGVERLRLLIAYDGGPFAGWQSQAGRNGVQDHLETALSKIAGVDVRVHGSGRTDAGVHARGQVAHVDVPAGRRETATWLAATNANLPAEIRLLEVKRVRGGRDGFHARYSATGKRYEYRIWNWNWLHPLEIGRAWHVPQPIDVAAMQKAAKALLGRHDFANFAANRGEVEPDTARTLSMVNIRRSGSLITLRFEGDGFLYKMVRLLTGTLARIGQGKAPPALIKELLEKKGAQKAQFAAPAEGLCLVKVFYGQRLR